MEPVSSSSAVEANLFPARAPTVQPGLRLFEKARLLEAKKKVLSTLVPEDCTFKPRTNTYRPRPSTAAASSPLSSSPAAAGRRAQKRTTTATASTTTNNQNNNLSNTINNVNLATPRTEAGSSNLDHVDDNNNATLTASRTPSQKEASEMTQQQQEQQQQTSITASAAIAEPALSEAALSSSSRLYATAAIHTAKLKARQAQAAAENSFSPHILERSARLVANDKAAKVDAALTLYAQGMRSKQQRKTEIETKIATQFSFKPHITSKAEKLVRPGSASARLHDPEWQRRRRAPEYNDPSITDSKGLTFKPQLIARPRSPSPSASVGAQRIHNSDGSSNTNSPSRDTSIPYHHAVNSLAAAAASENNPSNTDSVTPRYQALFDQAIRVRANREERAKEHVQREMEGCTFVPDISASKVSGLGIGVGMMMSTAAVVVGQQDNQTGNGGQHKEENTTTSAYDRLYERAMEKKERLRELQALEKPLQEECTFEPAISRASRRIASTLSGDGYAAITPGMSSEQNIASLLTSEGKSAGIIPRHIVLYEEGLAKRNARFHAPTAPDDGTTERDLKECTFSPKISKVGGGGGSSPGGNEFMQHHVLAAAGGGLSVHDRLYEDARNKQIAYSAAVMGAAPAPEQLLSLIANSSLSSLATGGGGVGGGGGSASGISARTGGGGGAITLPWSVLMAASKDGTGNILPSQFAPVL